MPGPAGEPGAAPREPSGPVSAAAAGIGGPALLPKAQGLEGSDSEGDKKVETLRLRAGGGRGERGAG